MQAFYEIEKDALALPENKRALLAEKLLRSLDNESLSEIDEAWVEEAERRYDNYRRGITKGISGETIFKDIKRELGWRK